MSCVSPLPIIYFVSVGYFIHASPILIQLLFACLKNISKSNKNPQLYIKKHNFQKKTHETTANVVNASADSLSFYPGTKSTTRGGAAEYITCPVAILFVEPDTATDEVVIILSINVSSFVSLVTFTTPLPTYTYLVCTPELRLFHTSVSLYLRKNVLYNFCLAPTLLLKMVNDKKV